MISRTKRIKVKFSPSKHDSWPKSNHNFNLGFYHESEDFLIINGHPGQQGVHADIKSS